jgi:uroporphyrin-3 C-methyltransferase
LNGVNSEIPQVETDDLEPLDSVEDEPVEKPRRRGSFAASLALLVALAALAGTAWMWWQDQSSTGQQEERVFAEIARLESSDGQLELKLRQLRDEVDSLTSADDGAQLAELENRLVADRSQLERAERAIREQTALAQSLQAVTDSMRDRLLAAEAALSAVTTRPVDAGGELDVAEVDYLLRLANERLQLFADPAAADQALAVADQHLAALDNPAYYGVRQEISAARRDLAAVDIPDYLEVAEELDAVQSAIPGLPFRGEEGALETSAPEVEDGWWGKLKGVFASLVTIRRSAEEADSRISLEDKDYVRQRVWLQLEIAHLALMRRDQAAFRGALGRVRESVDSWFDPADSGVQSVNGALSGLAELEIAAELPDITAPWTRLKGIRAVSSAPAPAAVPPPAEADPDSGPDAGPDQDDAG